MAQKTGKRRTGKRKTTDRAKKKLTLEEQVLAGKVRLEEIDLLRAQKFFHQMQSWQKTADEANKKLREAQVGFSQTVSAIKESMGLEPYHDVVLEDGPNAGLVFVNQQSKSQQEMAKTAKETVKKEEKKEAQTPEKEAQTQ